MAVNTNLAQKFADCHNMPLFETSAKDDERANHVEAIFMTLAHKLKNSKPMMPPHLADYLPGDVARQDYVNLRGSSGWAAMAGTTATASAGGPTAWICRRVWPAGRSVRNGTGVSIGAGAYYG